VHQGGAHLLRKLFLRVTVACCRVIASLLDSKLPFDRHWIIALVAPRPFNSLEGIDDQFANGNALKGVLSGGNAGV
jgi:hypothetical protein